MTSLYNEVVPERRQEYLECLERNLAHPDIDQITVFYDDSRDNEGKNVLLPFLKEHPVELITIDSRPSFSDIFTFVNKHYPDKKIIIANADIYFDETLHLLEDFDFTNRIIALSRWDEQKDRTLPPLPSLEDNRRTPYAQDTWIFRTPIEDFMPFPIELGTAFCDGYFNFFAYINDFKLCNPCYSIITHHLHTSNLRRWTRTEKKYPIQSVPWCSLNNPLYPSDKGIIYPKKRQTKSTNSPMH